MERFEDPAYTVIKQTHSRNGVLVSTVWRGLDHRFGDDSPPLIFETMVFAGETQKLRLGEREIEVRPDLGCLRTATEAEARRNHRMLVRKWRVKKRGRKG